MIKLPKIIMIIKKVKNQLKIFDIAIIAIFIFLVASLFFVLFRKQSKIQIVVKVNEESLVYQIGGVPSWFARFFHTGMKEIDAFGRPTAEIKGVKTFYTSNKKSVVYLTIDINTIYSPSNRQYTYKGKSVSIGSTIELPLDDLLVKGLVIDVNGSTDSYTKKIFAQARILNYDPGFPQTEGVPSYIADSINEGDVMKDSLGYPAIKIIKKTAEDAKMTVVTASGDVLLQRHPMRKDVFLDLEIWANKIGDRYYLFGDTNLPIIVSNSSIVLNDYNTIEGLPFNKDNSLIWLTITKINAIQ